MTTSGTVVPTVIANAAIDAALNGNTASTSTDNSVTYNTIPTVSNIAKTGNEDNNITFLAADFTAVFSDVDNDSLNKIKITSLPANGTLQIGGTNVILNQEILLGSISSLTFTPAANYNGSSSFTWNGSDGSNYAPTDATTNLTITAVNDPPSFTNGGNQTLTTWTNTAQLVPGWANTFVFGPPDEQATQAVDQFQVNITSGANLFASLPGIANNGTLSYTPTGEPGTANISVQLKDNGGIANSGNDTSAATTFTITIPAPTVNLTINTTTGTEAGTTAITLTAIAAGPVVNNQTLNLALTGTADNADFSGTIPAQITIADGSTSGQVTLTVANDLIDEDSETATFTISNPSVGIALGTTTSQTVTITDDDTASYDITTISGDTSELGGQATFDIKLTSQPTSTVTLNFTSSDTSEGTVIPTVTFDATNWNQYQTITITGVDDAVADGDINYNINGTATSSDPKYNNNNPNPVTFTNTDNDIPGVTVTQTGGNTELNEGSITDTYSIQLNTLPTGNVNVTATADAQTEISLDGVNFAPTQTLTFTIVNGITPQTVTVRAINDTIPEDYHSGNITHTISNSADANYPTTMTVGNINTHITDNDISYSLTGSSTTVTEGNSGTQQITYNITRTGALNETSTVDFSFSGTATNIADYQLVSITGTGVTTSASTITFSPNSTNATITVAVVGDQIDEDDESLIFSLVNPTATGTPSLIGSPVTTTITDDDTAGFIINPTSGLTTTEAGGTSSFNVHLTSQPTGNVTINLNSSNTAEGTIDKNSLTFTAANWSTPQTVTIAGVDDLVDDGNIAYNIITAAATSTDAKYNGMNADDVAVSNIDNDIAGVTITQTGGNTQLTEGGITDTYSIALNTLPTGNVQITATADAQTQVSLDGVNFAASQTLTFTPANGMTAQTVTVRAIDDNTTENIHSGSITNTITNSADANYATTMALDSITANITDNDISYSLTGGSANITEGNTGSQQIVYNITRTGATNETSTVDFNFSGSATNIADYKLVSITGTGVSTTNSTITFAPNATSATITVEVVGDQIDEDNETIEINLVNPLLLGLPPLSVPQSPLQ
ncbi:Calx-beta domain-containing protein [[Phormidium] sp. ETS-05]|uniref:beta strand repeat-containing protein n=1 Tax=[Phormidium] sp. ETS-05 TaxID=222819 RepID=UPI0018EF205A|nr:Calx-beta domain-containing protein [[Phormidium] sp. ETS-05]